MRVAKKFARSSVGDEDTTVASTVIIMPLDEPGTQWETDQVRWRKRSPRRKRVRFILIASLVVVAIFLILV